MEDFNSFVNNNDQNGSESLMEKIKNISKSFDGKSQGEMMRAIYLEAEKGKKNGTLSNADLENFKNMLSPFLDDKKRKMLVKIVEELKKI